MHSFTLLSLNILWEMRVCSSSFVYSNTNLEYLKSKFLKKASLYLVPYRSGVSSSCFPSPTPGSYELKCLAGCQPICLSFCYLYLSICLVCLSVYLSFFPDIYLSKYLSTHASVCFTYLPTYQCRCMFALPMPLRPITVYTHTGRKRVPKRLVGYA